MRTVYFDYNATTPLDPAVRGAMQPFLEDVWGNPSSVHHVGRKARAALDEARDRVSSVLQCKPSEIVFTSGGTESNNLAILGTARRLAGKGRHLITSSIEHHAVLHCFDWLERHESFVVTRLPVDREGFVDPQDLARTIRSDTTLVSIMAANNETGVVQDVAALGKICAEKGVLFHTDAVQWFGKEPFVKIDQFNADLVSICAHKIHGPKGAGALYVRTGTQPYSVLLGGSHENERRAGTENLAMIVGLTETVERFVRTRVFDPAHLKPLVDRLKWGLTSIPGVHVVTPGFQCLSNTLACVVEEADSIALLAGLDLEGVCASSGSACSAGSLEPSHVIKSLGYSEKLANALLRFSLGRSSTMEEVQSALDVLPGVIDRAQHGQ